MTQLKAIKQLVRGLGALLSVLLTLVLIGAVSPGASHGASTFACADRPDLQGQSALEQARASTHSRAWQLAAAQDAADWAHDFRMRGVAQPSGEQLICAEDTNSESETALEGEVFEADDEGESARYSGFVGAFAAASAYFVRVSQRRWRIAIDALPSSVLAVSGHPRAPPAC